MGRRRRRVAAGVAPGPGRALGLLRVVSLIDGGAAGRSRRRAGCRGCCRAACGTRAACTSSRCRRCRASAWRCSCCTTAICPRKWRARPGATGSCCSRRCAATATTRICCISWARTTRCRAALPMPSPVTRALATTEPQSPWRHDLVLRQLFTLKKLGRFEPAMALADAEMPHGASRPTSSSRWATCCSTGRRRSRSRQRRCCR